MISTLIIVLLALLSLVFLLRLAKGRAVDIKSPDDLRSHIRPVDVQAFRNLTNPNEEEFLHAHLSPSEFRTVQRARLRAALEYVFCVANNAAVLIRMAEDARHSADPSVAEAGQKLADSALRLRLFAFQASAKLYLAMIYPTGRTPSYDIAEQYERMTRQGILLGRMRFPARGISSAL
jgi:hypothetical protein